MNYFISDTQFGNDALRKACRGKFKSIEEMDNTIINNWNSVVLDDDTVYVLGDFWRGGNTPAEDYLQRLKGRKHLVRGNRDSWLDNEPEAGKHFERVEKHIELREEKLFLCHYPMLRWNEDYNGVFLIHGHIHSLTYMHRNAWVYRIMRELAALNANVDLNGYTPVTLEQLKENNRRFYKN